MNDYLKHPDAKALMRAEDGAYGLSASPEPEPNRFYQKIAKHGKAIGAAAEQGDVGAKQIMRLYGMHYDCPADPGARALCEAALDAWLAANAIAADAARASGSSDRE